MLPNILTTLRLILAPIIIYCIFTHMFKAALALFIIAGLTDFLDGYLARKFNQSSKLGSIIDPIADKLLIVGLFISLTYIEQIPFWLTTIVFLRDFFILMGLAIFHIKNISYTIRPLNISKFNTLICLLYISFSIVFAMLSEYKPWVFVNNILVFYSIQSWFGAVVAITTLASLVSYMVVWYRIFLKAESEA